MKKRILFVDDQRNVLDGLRRMLRVCRVEWEMQFAIGAAEALAMLEQAPFDVVVTDMRMPEMDGAQLLTEVRRRWPDSVRIVLSGQSEQETLVRAVGPAHQYLSKPCAPEVLKDTIARACALRDKLSNSSLKQLVSQISALPSLPAVYAQLVEELQSPDATIRRVADLISQDVGMTAKLLQLVNSSFFGLPQHIASPEHAATLLGLNLLKPLVLSAGIFCQFDGVKASNYSFDRLIEHSLAVSDLAKRIAESQNSGDRPLVEHSLLAGLVHDVGQIILAVNDSDQYQKTLIHARESGLSLCAAEMATIGATHGDVGAYLLGLWGLPDPIVEAVAWHHAPSKCPTGSFAPLTAVHVANVLVNQNAQANQLTYCLDFDFDYEHLSRVGVAEKLPQWLEISQSEVTEAKQ